MVSGSQPRLLLTSSLAPALTSSITASFDPRQAGPCSAVSPFLSTSLTGAPRSSRSFTASADSSGSPGTLALRVDADAGRHHQRRVAVDVGEERIGAELEQRLHHRHVHGLRRQEERRRAVAVQAVAPFHVGVRLLGLAGVDVGAVLDQLLREIEAAQVALRLLARDCSGRAADGATRRSGAAPSSPGRSAFGIGAVLQQRRGGLVVEALNRGDQRAGAVGQRLVDVARRRRPAP